MSEKINILKPTSIFLNGQLFQVGDPINVKSEFASELSSRFENYCYGDIIREIHVSVDTVCNSSYVNIGITQSYAGGLGYKFKTEKHLPYAFESKLAPMPRLDTEKKLFLYRYYSAPENASKTQRLISVLNIPERTKLIGNYLYTNHRDVFNFLVKCYDIRCGVYGDINADNYSNLMFSILHEEYKLSHADSVFYKLTQSR